MDTRGLAVVMAFTGLYLISSAEVWPLAIPVLIIGWLLWTNGKTNDNV